LFLSAVDGIPLALLCDMRLQALASRVLRMPAVKVVAIVFGVFLASAASFSIYSYRQYSRMIDLRLSGQVFQNTAKIYDSSTKLVTSLSGEARAKRRLVEFQDIPKVLIDAVTAGEDQKFFVHHGVDPSRIAGAFIWNLENSHRLQGASTITQQLARNFFLTPQPTLRRKISEAFIAVLLELRLSKQEIFSMYANEVYLGERGSYAIHGFGEAATALFGKDLMDLTLAETATIAGIIPAPNAFSPIKHADRAIFRRNLILKAMRENNSISEEQYQSAKEAELEIIQSTTDVTEAPYFVDFTRDELLKNYSEEELMNGGFNVYTTLDLDLQKAAVEAVAKGLVFVEEQFAKRDKRDKKKKKPGTEPEPQPQQPRPQAALIALDPRTGEIKAMVGGTDYTSSQYNRITQAFRQPGSVFKPFVFAAALETAHNLGSRSLADVVPAAVASSGEDFDNPSLGNGFITPVTTIMDAPRAFFYGGVSYEPNNFRGGYRGLVTIRSALQRSLNSATIQVAEKIGYDRVAALARRLGLNEKIKGYPSVALGAFEVTPIELAGAYTAFANQGRRVEPHAVRRVETASGSELNASTYPSRAVMDPDIAYLMTNLMEGVINRGTAAAVRSRGFKLPAAGKTGTSRDGWFVGYTKDLLVITWVGFDDNRDLNLEGSRSALPIWTEFMLKAYELNPPKNKMYFTPPPGIEFAKIDSESLKLATPDCTETYQEAFLVGTAPTAYCTLHTAQFATDVDQRPDAYPPTLKTSTPGAAATPQIIRAKPSN
jgi:penicillin-binding protein 1B